VKVRDLLADTGLKTMNLAHQGILRATGGRVLSSAFGMPAVLLETTGRKSGLPRRTMLTSPIAEGDRVVLVASKGGDHRHPDWYMNLVADPLVTITIRGRARPMVARVASAEEKADLWPRIVASYRGYAGYQRRTERDIPVVICEPRD
jgi:deazaflavin-dependent oxidoreductase (nitroreductase family)